MIIQVRKTKDSQWHLALFTDIKFIIVTTINIMNKNQKQRMNPTMKLSAKIKLHYIEEKPKATKI